MVDREVLEYVDHVYDQFEHRVVINEKLLGSVLISEVYFIVIEVIASIHTLVRCV